MEVDRITLDPHLKRSRWKRKDEDVRLDPDYRDKYVKKWDALFTEYIEAYAKIDEHHRKTGLDTWDDATRQMCPSLTLGYCPC